MKQIDDYVESLFRSYRKSKDIIELKEETRTHLQESVNELLAEGKTEAESIALAIERFADKNLNGELENVLQVRRTFARSMFYISLVLLAIAMVVGMSGTMVRTYYLNSQHTVINKTLGILRGSTAVPLSSAKVIEIETLVQKNDFSIQHIAIYHALPGRATPTNKPDFVYPPSTASLYRSSAFGYTVDGKWFMQVYVRQPMLSHALLRHYVPRIAFLGYWILFAIWASINAHKRKRLSGAWIVAFCILNFLAWILFRFSKRSDIQPASY